MRMQTERSKRIKSQTRSLGRGRATPSLFLTNPSKIVRLLLSFARLKFSKKTLRRLLPYHPIAEISRRSAQDDLLKWGAVGNLM